MTMTRSSLEMRIHTSFLPGSRTFVYFTEVEKDLFILYLTITPIQNIFIGITMNAESVE